MKKLSRVEMKNVMGGKYAPGGGGVSTCATLCSYYESGTGMVNGTCEINSSEACVCKGPNSSVVWAACNTEEGV